ncbi:hypothetical protein A2662_01110 [Candidatus Giovannonibacteria bacterium RIFCSPHIGHO2_01_FULL_45_33]|uniref:Uncharacterized protein n=1 Tax=Candidatus Giovannonibacteria bacterium RIFCSPLOWO2_01_FULL_45_34 TaxID=1798351 RepID=A0A1F5X0X8_9BACT|nr:MAG: hypothetical protein A2662_01110 [Candidatus Giovannonibacteria bacterium RIFCSPHIGHO2_01_FULL_45_33]OGF69292.1 MAG: hypothetical protein A3C73_01625 [Candidatus Giovannonibacteria bacterium RIFCSPHIGHO2_02_FULL_44_11]OGF81557.1 MAG: hypothetical protein A2930_04095 [Candidatus Giovannonibacteria bacterium RIFCSPLOWO2_01_FULL_45_34]
MQKKLPKPKGKIEYDRLKKKTDVINIAANWYLVLAMKNLAEDKEKQSGTFLRSQEGLLKDLKKEHEGLTADLENLFFAYLLFAVATELMNKDEIKASEKKIASVAGDLFKALPEEEDDLLKFFEKNVPTYAEALSFFMSAKKAFSKLKWDDGFGGKPWAKIADKTIMRLHGEIDPTVFIDVVFDIEHHSGHVFDKHENIRCDGRKLRAILDAKRDGALALLYKKFTEEHKYASSYVKAYYSRGAGAKWW